MGTALAVKEGFYDSSVFLLALLTTMGFQITSNFANDYGDGVKGTDNEDRIGPDRVLQSGLLSPTSLKRGIFLSAAISLMCTLALICLAFGKKHLSYFVFFVLLSGLCLWAAIKYTMGSKPYGYRSLGDVSVFFFFGLVGVLGSMFLYTKYLKWEVLLPATTIGLLCVGVLNLNNLRDIISDKKHGKNTLAVQMGFENGKRYHFALIIISFLCFAAYTLIEKIGLLASFHMIAFLPIFMHLGKVMGIKKPVLLDKELKKLAQGTFLLSLLFFVAVNYFL